MKNEEARIALYVGSVVVLFSALVALFATGCSGAPVTELGQLEQTYAASVTTNYQYGSQTAVAHFQCNRTSAGQVCSVPLYKRLEICVVPGFTVAQRTSVSNVVQSINAASNFPVNIVDCTAPIGASAIRQSIANTTIFGAPTPASNNIEDYSAVAFGNPVGLTEGVAGPDPVGEYQTHDSCSGQIDAGKLFQKGTSTLQDFNLLNHAVGHAILSCMGLGSRTDAGANGHYSRRTVSPNTALLAMTAGEACRASSFSDSANGDFSNTGFACPTVD